VHHRLDAIASYAAIALAFYFFLFQSTAAFKQFMPISGILSLRGCGWCRGSFVG
jgi:hypothetical protein